MNTIEKQIIGLMQNGDKRFVSILYDNYADSLYGVVFRILKNEAVAQDVLQDSFVKIWRKHGDYNPNKSRLFTWLLTICRNTAIDKVRSLKNKMEKEIHTEDSNVYDYRSTEYNPDTIDLRKHLSSLEEKYIEVIDALIFQGLTHKEASEKLNIPLGTLKTRFKIGIREMRKFYDIALTLLFMIGMLL
ncbi:MAG: sigma-70 family RNA polymerase sigma factor [Saprospiraceae bacterium]|nr:sigma-70 family RNA polymerase sigma factor [Saprospiraceae bacterium]